MAGENKCPTLEKKNRPAVDSRLEEFVEYVKGLPEEEQDGTLNYAITRIIRQVYPMKYRHQNRAMGMLACVQQEHYRRVIGPYENLKIEENGDVE